MTLTGDLGERQHRARWGAAEGWRVRQLRAATVPSSLPASAPAGCSVTSPRGDSW